MWNTDMLKDFYQMRRSMEDLRDRSSLQGKRSAFPLINAYESQDEYTVVAEIPGVKKEDVNVTFEDGVLEISGNRDSHLMKDDIALLRHEISEGSFKKSFRLPGKISEDMIRATVENGLLKIAIPKAEEAKPRQIEIQS